MFMLMSMLISMFISMFISMLISMFISIFISMFISIFIGQMHNMYHDTRVCNKKKHNMQTLKHIHGIINPKYLKNEREKNIQFPQE